MAVIAAIATVGSEASMVGPVIEMAGGVVTAIETLPIATVGPAIVMVVTVTDVAEMATVEVAI